MVIVYERHTRHASLQSRRCSNAVVESDEVWH